MSKSTRATLALDKAGIAYSVSIYAYDPSADKVGMQAAEAMGVDPGMVFKTLMVLADGKPACVVVPSDREVSMKKLAAVLGAKAAQMMKPADAERATGYVVGGISPFGQKKPAPTVLDESALALPEIFVNGGGRGVQVRLAPADLLQVLGAESAAVTA